ncbi:hypothetical protein Sste5346_001423 [Sporothrix stenoceras]|uniref:Argonaute complex, subunit Arb1 n=1 Tax=Sporothrix stenoceras TaxID=5173 RepID=A0ABR3ZQJ5_9PEZI
MPSVVDAQTAAPGIPTITAAAPPPPKSVTFDVPVGEEGEQDDLDNDDDTKGNLYEDAPKKEGGDDEDEGGVLIGPDGPVALDGPDGPFVDVPDGPVKGSAVDEVVDIQEATVSGKKKKKSKSTAARGPTALPKRCGTGFEEYYADPPLTIDEYEEEMDLYHATLNFDERIETCIQRYRARRRLDNDRTNMFNRYLKLGGIDCTPRMFNGAAGMEEEESLTKDDVRALTATDVVSRAGSKNSKFYASDNADLWTVDFAGVAAGFLSVTLRNIGGSNERLMNLGIDVVDNFLRYLQLHDVCPEYADDIKASREICKTAKVELPNLLTALPLMPGQFNLACTKLFFKDDAYSHEQMMASHDGLDPRAVLTNEDWDPEYIFRTTVAIQDLVIGTKAKKMAEADMSSIRIVNSREIEVEIVQLIWPDKELKERYAKAIEEGEKQKTEKEAAKAAEKAGDKTADEASDEATDNIIKRAGVIIIKHYRIEEGVANRPHVSDEELQARGGDAFFIDMDTMDLLRLGMKLRVVVHELNCDLNFVSVVKEMLPSFYLYLPQELMVDWKEPKVNDREGPSVNNPDAEAEAANEDMDFEDDEDEKKDTNRKKDKTEGKEKK